MRGCAALEHLAEGLAVRRLIASGCRRLSLLPKSVIASVVDLDISQCDGITELPDNFARLQTLDISGCSHLAELPDGIRIRSRIELAGSAVRSLPWSLKSVRISYRGMVVPDRIVFDPDSITVKDVLGEMNLAMAAFCWTEWESRSSSGNRARSCPTGIGIREASGGCCEFHLKMARTLCASKSNARRRASDTSFESRPRPRPAVKPPPGLRDSGTPATTSLLWRHSSS